MYRTVATISLMILSTYAAASPSPSPAPAPSAPPPPAQATETDFDHIDGQTLYFKAATGRPELKPVKTSLYDLKYLGRLRPFEDDAGALPYFLFSGKPCQECLTDSQIFAFKPTGGKPTAYVYPGKILETRTRALMLESRAFFGRCLARRHGELYVIFQKERVDRRRSLQSSVLIAEPGPDHMDEQLLERRLPSLQDTLRRVKAKACHEVEGRNRIMLSRPLDVRARRTSDKDDEEDDSAP